MRHGGDVAYEPRPERGARFVVRLPIGGDHA
jgi:signal transduction histidine kinase